MNNENLIHFTTAQSREEAVRNGQKGGKASVVARRKKRAMRDAMDYVMYEMELPTKTRKKLEAAGIDPKDFTHTTAVTLALVEKAEAGDVTAYNAIRDILGEKPKDKVAVEIPRSIKIEIMGDVNHDYPSSEDEIDL